MTYQVIIKHVAREQVKKREYAIIGKDEDGDDKYGYVDNETTKDVERTVFTQRVEDVYFNITDVIKAVNNLAY